MPTILESIDDFQDQSMTDKEREYVHTLRVMLKDLPDDVFRSLNTLVEEQRGERWSDMQLLVYINQAVADVNAEPPHTIFSLDDAPAHLKSCIINGSMIFALISEGIFQQGCFIVFKISFLLKKRISLCIIYKNYME